MPKSKATTTLDNGEITYKRVLNQLVKDGADKIEEAKGRVGELETAKSVFQLNAKKGMPIPGSMREER
ncbi:MAG: hypothetical protein JWO20_2716 [Candidatus Angelobacter sp.]|jgi:hypothetical protein|nr:hypothetical protein [Candidatus Angelobacter sp.]